MVQIAARNGRPKKHTFMTRIRDIHGKTWTFKHEQIHELYFDNTEPTPWIEIRFENGVRARVYKWELKRVLPHILDGMPLLLQTK